MTTNQWEAGVFMGPGLGCGAVMALGGDDGSKVAHPPSGTRTDGIQSKTLEKGGGRQHSPGGGKLVFKQGK